MRFSNQLTLLKQLHGLEYTFDDHDITLNIPEGAVAENEIIHIEIDATIYGLWFFCFPKNAQPISPNIWLCMLEKGTKLRKPLRLIILHFLSDMTRDQLYNHQVGFTKANHNNYIIENSEMKYKFHLCGSEPLFASKGNKSYAVLESDHCCFYCLQAKQTPELEMLAIVLHEFMGCRLCQN